VLKKIKNKWGIKSNFQFLIIFIVFGITGSSSVVLGKPILDFFSISPNLFSEIPFGNLLYFILRLIIIFPLYQVLLIIFGAIFFQFSFFWELEKKILRKMGFKI
jgi:hypothetical protein|tara:strand:- start:828 stop:1139 length:312 start_codon:yes stop_codon:yes gene_type:complete